MDQPNDSSSPDSDGEPPDPSVASNHRQTAHHPASNAPDLERRVRRADRAHGTVASAHHRRISPYTTREFYGVPSRWDKLSLAAWTAGGAGLLARELTNHYPIVREGLVATAQYVAAHPPIISALYHLVR